MDTKEIVKLLKEQIEQNRVIIANQEELKTQNEEIIEKLCNLSSLDGYNEG
jgi:hypothetical protein